MCKTLCRCGGNRERGGSMLLAAMHLGTVPWGGFLCQTIPYHTIPCYFMPYHTIPYHTIQNHTEPRHTKPHLIVPYHSICSDAHGDCSMGRFLASSHTIPYHTILLHTTPYKTIQTTLNHAIQNHTSSYHTTPYYVQQCTWRLFHGEVSCFKPAAPTRGRSLS